MSDAEPDHSVSPDVAVELQAKLFEQLTAGGVAGAGLTITLLGTILEGSVLVWIATAEFLLGAVVGLSGQMQLIEALSQGQPVWKKARLITGISTLLIGMGLGSLATDVYFEGKQDKKAEAAKSVKQVPPEHSARAS